MSRLIKNLRIVPRESAFLNRRLGSLGEIFFDQNTNTLKLFDGRTLGGTELTKSDLSNVSNSDFLSKATAAGVGSAEGGAAGEITIAADDSTQKIIGVGEVFSILGGDGIQTTTNEEGALTVTNTVNAFNTVAVSGQSSVTASNNSDTLTFIAGSNITITTSAESNSITINSTGAGDPTLQNLFATISGDSGATTANSATDTFTIAGGSDISTSVSGDVLTINYTGSGGGATTFSGLTDATTANVKVSDIYLPAITKLIVDNSGASAYLFDQYSGNNPTLFAISGTTIAFDLRNIQGHPFELQNGSLQPLTSGLIHVADNGTVSTDSNAQGKDSGVLYWKINSSLNGTFVYQCQVHGAMVGTISVKNISTI